MFLTDKIKSYFRSPLQKFGAHLLWGIVAAILFLGLFAKLVEEFSSQEVTTFHRVVTDFIQNFFSEIVAKVAIFITHIGSGVTLICVILLVGSYLLFRLHHVWETVILATSLLEGSLLNGILKLIFRRTRADIKHLVKVGGTAFQADMAWYQLHFMECPVICYG
ncbi:hypothetical protein [Aneurinibacillus thermoaerophilus]|uniref:Undecaprenyl-diphosphatase n=1 Tax=Aneurinibacillus thermoaerophilus TaxID=143495 RepID=A0A1G7ZBM2_ANETH|nr:hypothetical protein [Aneurinibacillus thermoaerophilus]MED0680419.1 hypothetical protein [Aneurinibacillus thermoaerophilus]MED0735886.1 hypothetical protein [Aneurinibacillus thermoaerophilus]MED0762807.1 hypothetical protein [Aneurinibacillus thermoaerophilus]QYY41247.1 hypothetical protein K3F53_09785 [Aneurinibacillus thermoaerophilus]SDH06029.1 undecaprenyl-diphosphatase [Aneurinibacillus thermoaerophilus]